MGRIVEASQAAAGREGPADATASTPPGSCSSRSTTPSAVIGKAGLGTPHMDGNTRLCTATGAAAFKESFGADGQPGSYTDIEHCDAIFLYGHNMAETQTVLWARILDRTRGEDPPTHRLRRPAPHAGRRGGRAHRRRAPRAQGRHQPGADERPDPRAVRQRLGRRATGSQAHTLGLDDLRDDGRALHARAGRARSAASTPTTSGGPRGSSVRATHVLSTVLQGFYQSHQATAASVAVNNLHLLRGHDRPARLRRAADERPADRAEQPRVRRRRRPAGLPQLGQPRPRPGAGADLWNVDRSTIPHWAPPTHAMQIFRYAEEGTIGLLWVSATNPAVSMPESARIRRILAGDQCFVIVQDLFLTETARARRRRAAGRRLGREDRDVHQRQPHRPPVREGGRAARARPRATSTSSRCTRDAMGFTDRDGRPLIRRGDAGGGVRGLAEATRGRPVDYTGLSYAKLRGPSGIPWPVNERAPDGTDRLYTDGVFPTDTDECETYGHDLLTGGAVTESEHRATAPRPAGRSSRGAPYTPAHEEPSDDYPLLYTTGRTVYQFHTRTKTGRARDAQRRRAGRLGRALAPPTPQALGVAEGDVVRVESPRGAIEVRARVGQRHGRARCSRRSTTAPGTPTTARRRPRGRRHGRPTS